MHFAGVNNRCCLMLMAMQLVHVDCCHRATYFAEDLSYSACVEGCAVDG